MQTLIHVTQDDIDIGTPSCMRKCPIALALKRTLALRNWPKVDTDFIRIEQFGPDSEQKILTPRDAEEFIDAFDLYGDSDEGDAPEPFSFWLEIPEPTQAVV